MSETLLIDCAWSKPTAAAMKAAGYSGVLGYISHDPGKDLTGAQAKTYRKAGHLVGFVFEATADRAKQGHAAGVTDCAFAEAEAAKRGYPTGCVIFYAVDFDADPKTVRAYFQGIKETHARYGWGPYGSARVIDGTAALKPTASWQTVAWSAGKVSAHANILQRGGKTRPAIKGLPSSGYDEDVLVRPCPLWGAKAEPAPVKPTALSRTHRRWVRKLTVALGKRTHPVTDADRKLLAALDAAALHALGRKP